MKTLILTVTVFAAITTGAFAQNLDAYIQQQIVLQRNEERRLDAYWNSRGYYRDAYNVYRNVRSNQGRNTEDIYRERHNVDDYDAYVERYNRQAEQEQAQLMQLMIAIMNRR